METLKMTEMKKLKQEIRDHCFGDWPTSQLAVLAIKRIDEIINAEAANEAEYHDTRG